MMSIFGAPFYTSAAPQPNFTTLFRLLDEYDSYAREQDAQRQRQPQPQQSPAQQTQKTQQTQPRQRPQRPVPTFRPRFDACETDEAYELHGELPGIERENLSIEFTDAQTLVVSGRVMRSFEKKEAQQQQQQQQQEAHKTQHNSHHATVEDDPEDETMSIVSTPSTSSAPSPKADEPATTTKTAKKQQPVERVLLYERSIGQFSRTFTFPGRIDQDAVTASLDHGVLTVVVPKAKAPAVRRIAIH